MTVWNTTGVDTLSTSLSAVGKGVLCGAVIQDAQSAKVLPIPLNGPFPESFDPQLVSSGEIPREFEDRETRWCRLQPYGRDEGHLLLIGERGIDAETFATAAEVACDLVNRLVEMNFELESLSHEVLRSYEAINFFYDVSAALSGCMTATALSQTILDRILSMVSARRAMITLNRPHENCHEVTALRGESIAFEEGKRLQELPILGPLAKGENSLLIDNLGEGEVELGELRPFADSSLLVVPLRWEAQILGLIVLADNGSEEEDVPFTAADGKLVETIATPAASILNTFRLMELQHEIELARRIQMLLLPSGPPNLPSLDVAGDCRMAGRVGGDMFDYVMNREGSLRVIVADVSGHNLAAALMMAVGRAVIRLEAAQGNSPEKVASRVNENLFDDLSRSELFITFFLASYCPKTRSLSYASAGHNPPLLCRTQKGGKIERLEAAGVPTGILKSFAFEERRAQLWAGDVLVIYTDGITEAKDPEGNFFGEEGLRQVIHDSAQESAETILKRVLDAIRVHTQDALSEDDRTVVVLKVEEDEGEST